MKRIFLAAALALTACASGTGPWVRPGVDQAKNEEDFRLCGNRAEQIALAGVPPDAAMPGTPSLFREDRRFGTRVESYTASTVYARNDPLARVERDNRNVDMYQRRDEAMTYCMQQAGFTLAPPPAK